MPIDTRWDIMLQGRSMPNQYTALHPLIVENPHAIRKAVAAIMIEQGSTYDEIVEKTGVSKSTISWIKQGMTEVNQDLVARLKKSEVDKLTYGIHSILDNTITPDKIEKASLQQGVTSAAILIEKRELLAGRATVRVGADIPDQGLADRIAALEREIEAGTINVTPELSTGA